MNASKIRNAFGRKGPIFVQPEFMLWLFPFYSQAALCPDMQQKDDMLDLQWIASYASPWEVLSTDICCEGADKGGDTVSMCIVPVVLTHNRAPDIKISM